MVWERVFARVRTVEVLVSYVWAFQTFLPFVLTVICSSVIQWHAIQIQALIEIWLEKLFIVETMNAGGCMIVKEIW